MTPLQRLAEQAGIAPRWRDAFGESHEVAPETLRYLLQALGLPCANASQVSESRALLQQPRLADFVTADVGGPLRIIGGTRADSIDYELQLESGSAVQGKARAEHGGGWRLAPIRQPGYHRLQIGNRRCTIAVAPPRCWLPAESKLWSLAAQVYGLRRAGDGGIGSYAALGDLAAAAAAQGAAALAISPVHAMFSSAPERYSPYSPSSRLYLNAFLIDAGAARQSALERKLEKAELIDWPQAARARLARLRQEWQGQRKAAEFTTFREQGGDSLQAHALFETIAQRHGPDWRLWPAELRTPESKAARDVLRAQADEVEFHTYLQWRAATGLDAAQARARDGGMRIGLIADLAVGCDPGGSEAWSGQEDVLKGLSVGAPPDLISREGQAWGLTAFSPRGLQQNGYARFIACLRAALRHAGGLRIDHVMGLMRLWLVPERAPASAGAYVNYPLQDLLRLICLESWRHQALIIGEDLGTVPEGFRERLQAAGILGMRVLPFERNAKGKYLSPDKWSRDCVAFSSTHDLATAAGWPAGNDIRWRRRLGFIADDRAAAAELKQRKAEARALQAAYKQVRIPAATAAEQAAVFIGRSNCRLALLPLEDALGLIEQPNLPGSVDTHPNWQRRYPATSDKLLASPKAKRSLKLLAKARQNS